MVGLDSPHTQSLLIAALANRGFWKGQRKGIVIRLYRELQTDLEGRRIVWTAFRPGDYRHRKHGAAGTVREALDQISQAVGKTK